MINYIAKIGISVGLAIASLFGYQSLQVGSTLPINGSTYNLAGSGITSSATSITLSTFTIKQTGQKILDADVGDIFYLTIEPGNNTRQEVVSCTTVTQGVTTATLSGCSRGLSPISPYTASTTLQFAHGGGSQVIFGDAAQLFNLYTTKANDEAISGLWTFTTSPYGSTPTTTSQFATKGYVDSGVLAGAATSTESVTGISRLATAIQQASSTPSTTNTPLVLQAQYASSSPTTGCNGTTTTGALCNVVARNDGKIHPNYIATSSTDTYNWGATMNYTGTELHTGQATFATSTISNLNIGVINSTTTASNTATSTITNLKISNNATTTSLTVSGACIGCPGYYLASSTTYSVSSGAITYTGSIPTLANIGIGTYSIGGTYSYAGIFVIARTGSVTATIIGSAGAGNSETYDFQWSGNNFIVTETTDQSSAISGIIYWYK